VLRNQLMHIMAGPAAQRIEVDELVFEARVFCFSIFVAVETGIRLNLAVRQWIAFGVYAMAIRTGQLLLVVYAVLPFHGGQCPDAFCMAISAGAGLFACLRRQVTLYMYFVTIDTGGTGTVRSRVPVQCGKRTHILAVTVQANPGLSRQWCVLTFTKRDHRWAALATPGLRHMQAALAVTGFAAPLP